MNLDETSSPGAKRSRNHTKAHVGKLRKQAACEENDNEEEDEEGDWNGLDEDDVVGIGGMKSSSSSWQMQQQASRIFRVSRASGGKDRHSKVLTAKGLRDRRVRLSVSTAIQFYDLQGRLGYDQPSKAVDWLIKATTDAISELPSLDGTFPNNASLPKPNPPLSVSRKLARSACSSTSETTRASLLSLSRSETGVKAREQARDRTKEKKKVVTEKDKPLETNHPHHQTHSSSSSFAELLMNCNNQQNDNSSFVYKAPGKLSMVVKKLEHPSLQNTDYFSPNTISAVSPPGQASASKTNAMGLGQFANPAQLMSIVNSLAFGDHPELQQFAVSQDHHGSIATNSNDYSLDFSMSSFSADSNRGTLQSNSSVLLPHHHLQKFSSSIAASESATPGGMPFFIGAAQSADGQFPTGFDPRLQLCYNDGCRQSDLMGKERN